MFVPTTPTRADRRAGPFGAFPISTRAQVSGHWGRKLRHTECAYYFALWLVVICPAAAYGQPPDDEPAPVPFPGATIFNDQPPFLADVKVDHADFKYREGDRLRVQFKAEREAYLYLIYHQADGRSRLLFPNPSQPDNHVPAKQATVIPDPKQPLRFRIQPPFGTEVLQVLATFKPLAELDALVQSNSPPKPGQPGRAPDVSQALLDTLRDRLRQDLTGWTEHRALIRSEAKAAAAPPSKAARVGLFIGIGKYLHPEFAPTHEELGNSAKVMHELMLKRGGLDPAKTKLALDEQATKAQMQELIARWLPSVSKPGDTVFIYFSGHAGQLDTTDPSELDGMDETIGPYDLNAGAETLPVEERRRQYRESSILDDTLARWLQELAGRQVVFIVDTCHSGGLVQGKAAGFPGAFLADEAARLKDLAQSNMLVLTSCASDEQSLFEGLRSKTMWFTHCLAEAIERPDAPKPLSVQAAFDYGRQRMKELLVEGKMGIEQEPTMTDSVLLPVVLAP
ncbi:MAG TPA: DUF4384 domain-containing protein [Pirellulales bacterium]|nr:DUF4384 domain-containing protein [Pirellulales bacterium]